MTLPASSYAHIRQTLWVLSGALVITEAGERHELGAGDCLGFGPPAETTFANETQRPASTSLRWPGAEMMPPIRIAPLTASPDTLAALSEMLVETVAHGGSVSFMHPLPLEAAEAFWRDSLGAAARGERIVLGAFDGDKSDRHRHAVARTCRRTSRIAPRSRR